MPQPYLWAATRILILLPDRDSPPKKDYSQVFLPEAEKLFKIYKAEVGNNVQMTKITVPTVDPSTLTIASAEKQKKYEEAARQVIAAIRTGSWSRIIFMCHGWSTGVQLGFRIKKQKGADAKNLADLIAALKTARPASMALFACSAGDEPASLETSPGTGDNSFADYLRDNVGCSVVAHWTAGHATRNPDLIFFEAAKPPLTGGIGGVAWPTKGSSAYRNAVKLLTLTQKNAKGRRLGDIPPKGCTRPVFASIPLCTSLDEFRALLSSEPA